MTVEIASMTLEDYDEVFALWQKTDGVGLNESDSRENVAIFLDRNPGYSLVARQTGRLIAPVLCGHDGRRGCLRHLVVEADCSGQGLGRRLVETCLSRCNILLLADNNAGEQFGKRLGWYDRSELKIMQRPTEQERPS